MNRGYSVSSLNTAYLIQNVFKISKKNFALCPYDRFNCEAPAIVGDINMFPSVITNERADAAYKEYYFQHKIQVFATFNIYFLYYIRGVTYEKSYPFLQKHRFNP